MRGAVGFHPTANGSTAIKDTNHMKRAGTFHQLVYHFTWGTKNCLPMITPDVEARLYPYIGYKCKQLGYHLHAVNGVENHIHILVNLTPSHLVADVAKNLKGASSHYINKESGLDTPLYWQDGYGVVTIRMEEIPGVVKYIQNQKEHHHAGKLSKFLERTEA
jgi:putative transposase